MTISAEVIQDFIAKATAQGYGSNQTQFTKLRAQISAGLTPDTLLDPQLTRYGLPALIDETTPLFNANKMFDGAGTPQVWVGEGPYFKSDGASASASAAAAAAGTGNFERFLSQFFFNDRVAFENIIALGPFVESHKEKFSDYLNNTITVDSGYRLSGTADATETPIRGINQHTLVATELAKNTSKTVSVTHFSDMVDRGALYLTDIRVAKILQLYLSSLTQPVFIHCSAGLGRSGAFAFAFAIMHDYDAIMALPTDADKADQLLTILNGLNEKRPGTVREEIQLQNAVQIASRMHALLQVLQARSITADTYITQLLAAEAEDSSVNTDDYSDSAGADSRGLDDDDALSVVTTDIEAAVRAASSVDDADSAAPPPAVVVATPPATCRAAFFNHRRSFSAEGLPPEALSIPDGRSALASSQG